MIYCLKMHSKIVIIVPRASRVDIFAAKSLWFLIAFPDMLTSGLQPNLHPYNHVILLQVSGCVMRVGCLRSACLSGLPVVFPEGADDVCCSAVWHKKFWAPMRATDGILPRWHCPHLNPRISLSVCHATSY